MKVDSALFSDTLIIILVLISIQKYSFDWGVKSLKRPGLELGS